MKKVSVTLRKRTPESIAFRGPSWYVFSAIQREKRELVLSVSNLSAQCMREEVPQELQTPRDSIEKTVSLWVRHIYLPGTGLSDDWEMEYPLMDAFMNAPPQIKLRT